MAKLIDLIVSGKSSFANDISAKTIYSTRLYMSGAISTCNTPGSWVSGMTNAAIRYNDNAAISTSSYHPFLSMTASGGHVVNFGGLGNTIGFYGYYNGRTANSYDWSFTVNSSTGKWSMSNSITSSAFITSGGANTQVVRGDGTLQTISSLSVSYANSAGNADTVDGHHLYTRNLGVNGTSWTFASTANANATTHIYAPTAAGTSGQILKSTGGTPTWINQSDISAGSATKDSAGNTISSYYLPLSGGIMSGPIRSDSGYVILNPIGASYHTTTGAVTGCITINLPASLGNTMVSMWIDVYIYEQQKSFSVHCGGYTYSNSTWQHSPFAIVYGANHRVRLGHNGTQFVVYIGETNTVWSYPQVSVRNVTLGHLPTLANWAKTWSVSFSTSVSNVTYDTTTYAWTTKNLSKSEFATASHNHDSTYVKYAKVSKSTADSTNAYPYIYNVENETLVSGYYAYWYILNFGKYSGGNYVTQIAMPYQDSLTDSELFIRSAKGSTWRTWRRVLHSNNYTEYTVKKDGTGASGTWGINISGNADTVDGQHFNWNNNKNDHTYLWAASSNGQSYLVHRASMGVNYANSAGSANSATIASTVTVNSSDSNSTYRMVWHSGNTLYSTDGIYCNPYSDVLNAKAYTLNGASSAGTNYITGTAGRIFFGGNFHIDSLGSNATYINHYTANNVYLVSGSSRGKVGIGTSSPKGLLSVYSWCSSNPSLGNLGTSGTVEFGAPGAYGTYFWTTGSGKGFIQQGRTDGSATSYDLILQPLGSNVGIGTSIPSYKLHVAGDVYANGGWLRSSGSTGWYNESYGGGIYMNDSTFVRIYNGKYLYTTYQYYDVGNQDYTIDRVYASNDRYIRPMAFSTFTTKLLSQFGITTDTRRSKNSSNANIESVTGYVMKNKSFIDIWGFAPTATYRTTKDRPAPYGIGFTDGSDSGGIMPVGDSNALKEIRFYGANSGPTHFTFGRMNWESTSYDSDNSNRFSIYTDIDGTNGNMWTSGSVAIGTSSFDSKLRVYGGIIRIDNSSRYLFVGPQNSSHAHYETNADVSHWFNKRVDVNGAIWRYNTNYGISSDGYFYAKGVYANRDGASTYGGISLYSTSDPITEYGIAFRGTGNYGKIGRVQGDWATYFTMDSSHNRGWIFRSGGTNYASVSARGEAYFNSVGTNNYIAYPSGGFFSRDGGKSGYIIITIPANYKSCTMMRFNVEIYNYSTGTSTTYTIGGYNYDDGNWYNVFAYANRQGTTGYGNLTVRFGHNGTNSIIWIGESNTSYSYPKVRITNVTLGHSTTDYNTWAAGWSVTIATTAPTNVSQTVTNPATNYYAQSAGNADTVDGQHFNWNNNKNDHTYLWAASSNGQAYLVHRASMSVNYANSAGSASSATIASTVTVNSSDANSTYRMVWHSGNTLYGTGGIYCNPSSDYLYATSVQTSDWFRSTGNSGWYSQTYGGGWYMNDTTYIRVYNSKRVYNDNTSQYAFYTAGGMTALGHMYSSSSASSWIAGQNATNAALNIGDATDTGSYWPWFRQTNTSSKKWVSVGTLNNSLYFIGSATSRTANSYDYGFRMDFSNGYLYGNFSGYLSGRAAEVTVNNSDSNSTYRMVWHSGNTLYSTAGIYCNPSTDALYASAFYETSDVRLKQNIKHVLTSNDIPQIKEFDWKNSGKHSYGLIAQELESMGYSELVDTKDDGYKSVNYTAALCLIIGKLQLKIKELEDKIKSSSI